jgi:hypothetical protein
MTFSNDFCAILHATLPHCILNKVVFTFDKKFGKNINGCTAPNLIALIKNGYTASNKIA